jgi:undecaprenyl-diphosphatase
MRERMRRLTDRLTEISAPRLVAGKLLLIALLGIAVSEISMVARLDLASAEAIHRWTFGWVYGPDYAVTDLGSTHVVLAVAAVGAAVMVALRHWRGAIALMASVLATQVVVAALKGLVERPRPATEADGHGMLDPSGWSFPSAHSASAVALYAMLALVAGSALRRGYRSAAYLTAGLVVFLVGASRISLGAHYPTDVIAGWLLGGAVVAVCWAALQRVAPARRGAFA